MPDLDLTHPTEGELLWMARREARLTLAQAARAVGVGKGTYAAAEGGRRPLPGALHKDFRPTLPLLLALARRRSGLDLRRAARIVGCSHVVLLKREVRGDPGLAEFWRGRGFTFDRPVG